MDFKAYKNFLNDNKHEYFVLDYIENRAVENGYELYDENKYYDTGDKLIFKFNKFIALIELGEDFSEGANMIISHIDSPRLDVIPNNPYVEKDDGVFWKVSPYGGIIAQSWLDRPLALVGKAYDKDGNLVIINTEKDKVFFTISSLLPHLSGRKEMKDLTLDKLMVRMGRDVIKKINKKYKLNEDSLKLADLSFVPAGKAIDIGFDKELIASYGHDDRCCAFAELEAMFTSEKSTKTKIALFTSYEETGSGQSSGAESKLIDDIFLELLDTEKRARKSIRNSKMLSADVCAGFDSAYSTHFEENCKPILGKGVGIVPFLGNKRGNDSTIEMREFVRKLCVDNNINYQIETTKVTESGGGTVSTFFCIKGIEVIDAGIPVLAMHSPQELISKKDLESTYKLYKAFFESN
jgi:aspartyl aminopeptidase